MHYVYRQKTYLIFFFNDTATTEIYTLSLHDALPIYRVPKSSDHIRIRISEAAVATVWGSEEHTSELQSPKDLVCRLLLEKQKTNGRGSRGARRGGVGAGERQRRGVRRTVLVRAAGRARCAAVPAGEHAGCDVGLPQRALQPLRLGSGASRRRAELSPRAPHRADLRTARQNAHRAALLAAAGARVGQPERRAGDGGRGRCIGLAARRRGRLSRHRSEERRVGKECRSRWSPYH